MDHYDGENTHVGTAAGGFGGQSVVSSDVCKHRSAPVGGSDSCMSSRSTQRLLFSRASTVCALPLSKWLRVGFSRSVTVTATEIVRCHITVCDEHHRGIDANAATAGAVVRGESAPRGFSTAKQAIQ